MEKNQEFTVTIEDMNEDGAGVGNGSIVEMVERGDWE